MPPENKEYSFEYYYYKFLLAFSGITSGEFEFIN